MALDDVVYGVKQLNAARPDYLLAEEFYNGTAKEHFINQRVAQDLRDSGVMGRFNFIKRIVNTVANRMKLASIAVPGEPDSFENVKLNDIRTANEMELYEKLLIRKTLMYGDAYVIVWPVSEDDPTEDDAMISAGVSLAYNSPFNVRMIYDPSNERKPIYAIKSWNEGKRIRADLYYNDYVERWITISDNVKGERDTEWQRYTVDIADETGEMTSDNGVVSHDFGEIPVIHFRTDLTYGTPEAIDGYNPQRAINKGLVTLSANIESAGYPSRYMLMDPAAIDTNTNEEDPEWDGDDTAQPAPQPQNVKDQPGTVLRLNGAKSVGQWDLTDPTHFLTPIKDYIRYMALVTETPAYELNPDGAQPSGEARRQADKPLESKVADRQTILRGSFASLYRLALKASDIVVATVEIQWAPTDPITLDQKVATLGNIGKALKDLATAETLGVISKEQIGDIISSFTDME